LMYPQISHLVTKLSLSLLLQFTGEIFGKAIVYHKLGLFVVYLQTG
jgi:hypothetical protein